MAYPSDVQHQKLPLFPNFHDFLTKPHGCPSPSSKALHYNGFLCSAEKSRSAFFRSANSILRVAGKPSEAVLMKLLYSVCVPNVTYACEVTDFKRKDIEALHVAVNDSIRRIFSYNRWESIKDLRESMGYQSITQIFANQ